MSMTTRLLFIVVDLFGNNHPLPSEFIRFSYRPVQFARRPYHLDQNS